MSNYIKLTTSWVIVIVLMLAWVVAIPNDVHAAIAETWPTTPPAQICGNAEILDGPETAPAGAIVVPAGDNSALTVPWNSLSFARAGTTFWFAPGVHTLGAGEYSQIAPGDNTTFIGAPGAIIDGQHINKYAFTNTHTGVTIKNLTVQNFGADFDNRDEGVVNHDRGANWTIQNNTFTHNEGAAVMLGSNNLLSYNCLKDNGQYGFSTVPPQGTHSMSNVTLDHNEITGNNTDDWEARMPGCGCTGGGKFWETRDATITNNYVHNNKSVGIWADTNDVGFQLENNYISDNDGQGFFYEISYNAVVRNNNFLRNGLVRGPLNGGFPTGAIYLSEAGGDARVTNAHGYSTIDISANNFQDNWSGVVEWENADRFCGSPSNTSSGTCTLVNPDVTLETCAEGTINTEPNRSDCRWKTQNVTVHDNRFAMDKDAIAGCASAPQSCGLQGLFSNYGTYPSWSPYMGQTIENAVTNEQNNTFANNEYDGDWRIMVHDQGRVVTPDVWQGNLYRQDQGSVFTGLTTTPTPTPTPTPIPAPAPAPLPTTGQTKTFENGTDNVAGWFGAIVSQSAAQAHGGTHGLAVTEQSRFWGVQDQFPTATRVAPGQVYTVSGWARASALDEQITLRIRWSSGSGRGIAVSTVATATATSSEWVKLTGNLTAPEDATVAQFVVTSGAGAEGNVMYFDDLAIAPVPSYAKTFENDADNMFNWFNTAVAISTAQAHSGSHSLVVTEQSRFWGVEEHLTPVAKITSGVRYRIGSWARGVANQESLRLSVRWVNGANKTIALDTVATADVSGNVWTQIVGDVTAPVGATRAQFIIQSGTGGQGNTVYLDDLSITPIGVE
jgi:hypothetical protein